MSRKFGIEVEFSANDGCSTIVAKMEHKGLEVKNIGTYTCSDGNHWELKTDSSAQHNGMSGYELASRILQGNEGMQELDWYITAMNDLRDQHNWSVNRSCGVHVNIDVSDLTSKQICNLVKLVMNYEKVLYAMQPASRTGCRYCRPIQGDSRYEALAGFHGELAEHDYREYMSRMEKYSGLNLRKVIMHGIAEFRYGAGSLSAKKIMAWTGILLALVEKAKAATSIRVDVRTNTKTFVQRKEELRKNLSILRQQGITHRMNTLHQTINKRFEKFENGRAERVPEYGRVC